MLRSETACLLLKNDNNNRTSHRTEHRENRKRLRDNLVTPHMNNCQSGLVPMAEEWRRGRWRFQNVAPADHDELGKQQNQRWWRCSRHKTRSQNEPKEAPWDIGDIAYRGGLYTPPHIPADSNPGLGWCDMGQTFICSPLEFGGLGLADWVWQTPLDSGGVQYALSFVINN